MQTLWELELKIIIFEGCKKRIEKPLYYIYPLSIFYLFLNRCSHATSDDGARHYLWMPGLDSRIEMGIAYAWITSVMQTIKPLWKWYLRKCKYQQIPLKNFNNPGIENDLLLRWKDQVQSDLEMPLQDAEHHAQGWPERKKITCRKAKRHRPLPLSQVKSSATSDWFPLIMSHF